MQVEPIKLLEIVAKYNLKMFDQLDWDGYAGAEAFNDFLDPFTGSLESNAFDFFIIIDKNGIEVSFDDKTVVGGWDMEPDVYHRDGKLDDSLMFLNVVDFALYNKHEIGWILENFFVRVNG